MYEKPRILKFLLYNFVCIVQKLIFFSPKYESMNRFFSNHFIRQFYQNISGHQMNSFDITSSQISWTSLSYCMELLGFPELLDLSRPNSSSLSKFINACATIICHNDELSSSLTGDCLQLSFLINCYYLDKIQPSQKS